MCTSEELAQDTRPADKVAPSLQWGAEGPKVINISLYSPPPTVPFCGVHHGLTEQNDQATCSHQKGPLRPNLCSKALHELPATSSPPGPRVLTSKSWDPTRGF